MNRRTKVYGFLVAVIALSASGYFAKQKFHFAGGVAQASVRPPKSGTQPNNAQKDKEKESTPVELAAVSRGAISAYISSTANLRALRDVAVTTQVEGLVQRVLAEEGDYVKEGQVLCMLDDTQLRINLELVRQKLAQAKLQLEKARIRQEKAQAQIGNTRMEVERYNKAEKEGLVSEADAAKYRYQLEELEHDRRVSAFEQREFSHRVAELEAEIAQAELQISRSRIKASFSGHITRRMVELGQRVQGLDPLFNLAAFSPLYADVFLSEQQAQRVRAGQAAIVRLGADGAASAAGRVDRISPVVDQATGTVKVTVALNPADAGFKPGAFVRVEITTDTRSDAVLVPKRAVLEEDGQNYVFVVEGETAKRTKVMVGYENGGSVEITDGLSAGQKVVVAGQGALKDGGKIKVIQT